MVPASSREFPVASCPPADRVAVVPSSFFASSGALAASLGASTRAFASGGGVPKGGGSAEADDEDSVMARPTAKVVAGDLRMIRRYTLVVLDRALLCATAALLWGFTQADLAREKYNYLRPL